MNPIFLCMASLLPDYRVKSITNWEYQDVYALYRANPDFFKVRQNHPVTLQEAIEGIIALPPGTDRSRKHFLGFYRKGRLEAVLDYIDDYPCRGVGWIGMFLADGVWKDQSTGHRILEALFAAMKQFRMRSAQLAVIEGNDAELAFWTGLKFHELRRQNICWRVVVLERVL